MDLFCLMLIGLLFGVWGYSSLQEAAKQEERQKSETTKPNSYDNKD